MGKRLESYWYAYGFKSRDRAEIALGDAFAAGEVSLGENPRIESYAVMDDKAPVRYGIMCDN